MNRFATTKHNHELNKVAADEEEEAHEREDVRNASVETEHEAMKIVQGTIGVGWVRDFRLDWIRTYVPRHFRLATSQQK